MPGGDWRTMSSGSNPKREFFHSAMSGRRADLSHDGAPVLNSRKDSTKLRTTTDRSPFERKSRARRFKNASTSSQVRTLLSA